MERKYSMSEIDRMRRAIRWSYPTGVSFNGAERDADIENRLRTYMQNGTTVEEIEEWSRQQRQNDIRMHEAARKVFENSPSSPEARGA